MPTLSQMRLKEAEEERTSTKQRLGRLMEQLLKEKEEKRALHAKDEERELAYRKKLEEEEAKIRLDAQKKAEDDQRLKILEKEKQLESALKETEDLRRKLQQGSQQLQGEAFELAFESLLATQYAHDKILPVGKGIKGGDIIQEVWDAKGNYVGKILWELKNTKTWGPSWIDKLKNDKRTINADEAVLITEILPPDMKTAGWKDNVWVTRHDFVIPLADTLRAKLIQLFYVKNSVQGKDKKMEILYSYLSGSEFRHRVEAIVEAFSNMQAEIEKEKRYFSNKWARDEKNIRQVIDNTYGMHGDFKGIIGSALAQIKGLDTLELDDGEA
ncbi:MAG: DUF2130 domain-containing protein [Candidatus Levybacteria bacterium]|nr:DUF2130 domain-containing protein [Candidatus Levybacteria bacterium]